MHVEHFALLASSGHGPSRLDGATTVAGVSLVELVDGGQGQGGDSRSRAARHASRCSRRHLSELRWRASRFRVET